MKTDPTTSDNIHISKDIRDKFRRLATSSRQPTSRLIERALAEYLEVQAWRDEETRKGLLEAESGDTAAPEQVQAVFDKWLHHGGSVDKQSD